MALQINYTGDAGSQGNVFGANWKAQTFTTSGAFTITSVVLKLIVLAGTIGNVTCELKAVDGSNKPTGSALATATISGAGFSGAGAEETFTFASSYALSASTMYAIVLSYPTGSGSSYFGWNGTATSGYADGAYIASSDSGATWGSPSADTDFYFKTYGDVPSTFVPQITIF